jgi:hypothetical protein
MVSKAKDFVIPFKLELNVQKVKIKMCYIALQHLLLFA